MNTRLPRLFFCITPLLLLITTSPSIFRFIFPGPSTAFSFLLILTSLITSFASPRFKLTPWQRRFIYSLWLSASVEMILGSLFSNSIFLANSLQVASVSFFMLQVFRIRDPRPFLIVLIFFSAVALLGCFSMLAAFVFKPAPFFSYDYSESGATYLVYATFTNAYDSYLTGIMRFAGFFDETGNFSLYTTIILVSSLTCKRIVSTARVSLIILLLSTFFALSFGYIIAILSFCSGYLSGITLSKVNAISLNKRILYSSILAVLLVLLVSYLDTPITSYILSRFQPDSLYGEGTRFDLYKQDLSTFANSPLFGALSSGSLVRQNNIFSIPARSGLVGSIFYYLPFATFSAYILVSLKSVAMRTAVTFVLLSFFLHRPELNTPSLTLMFGLSLSLDPLSTYSDSESSNPSSAIVKG